VDLTAQWLTTLGRAGATPDPALGETLIARYAEPHRYYHSVAHLTAVLSTVDTLVSYAANAELVRLAAWYHDAIYDPRSADNEERSAQLAESGLAVAGLPADSIAEVTRLIRLTASHDPPAGDRDAEVLCDADLAVLASPAPAYDRYVAAVRQEYAHVDEAGWRIGRSAVLEKLLAQPWLFRTAPGRSWEQRGRANIRRELATLADPSGGVGRPH
jgi:predicted metal-dependent HD superfamily phosphohydrolase